MSEILKGYKYVDPAFANNVAKGALKIGTADHYAKMESPLADALDSRVRRQQTGMVTKATYDPNDLAQKRALARVGIVLGTMSNIANFEIGYNSFDYAAPARYVLCLSRIANNDHLVASGSSAVFAIEDVGEFARVLQEANPGKLGPPAWERVQYHERVIPAEIDTEVPPDPFIKRPSFFPEMELRITWVPVLVQPDPWFISEPNERVAKMLSRLE